MIALLAQFAFGCFAAYGLYVVLSFVTAAFQGWLDAKRVREQEARSARMEREAKRMVDEWWAREQLRHARSIANRQMLSRLTTEDHAEIERTIHEAGGRVV